MAVFNFNYRHFSKKTILPKFTILDPHPKKVRNERMLKSIKLYKKIQVRPKHPLVENLEDLVFKLQPNTFLAPLNPCPVYNPKYGIKKLTRSIKHVNLPLHLQIRKNEQPRLKIYKFSKDLEPLKDRDLDYDIFAKDLRKDIVHRTVRYFLAKKRQGTSKEKSRSEVRGGGKKPWKQKGTGRARHGSIRSPIFRGGGKVFPKRPGDYSIGLQKKVRRQGLKMMLTQKYREGNLLIIDKLPTKAEYVEELVNKHDLLPVVIIDSKPNIDNKLEFRKELIKNENIHCIPSIRTNVFLLLKMKKVIFTESGLEELEKKYSTELLIREYNRIVDENIKEKDSLPDVEFR